LPREKDEMDDEIGSYKGEEKSKDKAGGGYKLKNSRNEMRKKKN